MNKNNPHGGDVWNAAHFLNVEPSEVTDLSGNIAPFFPPFLDEIIQDSAQYLRYLPESFSAELAAKIEEKFNLPENSVVLGAGTTELIDTITRLYANQSVLIPVPTYTDYQKYSSVNNLHVLNCILLGKSAHLISTSEIERYLPNVELVFLCHPNNPNGALYDINWIEETAKKYPRTKFVIDESYMPFVTKKGKSALKLRENNIVVLRSLSKIYGIPGLRVGFFYCPDIHWNHRALSLISPWSVNLFAQKIALRLMDLDEKKIALDVHEIKEDFLKELTQFSWLKVLPSSANFFLCELEKSDAKQLYDFSLQRKFLIRDCSNIQGLGSKYIRLAVQEGDRLREFIQVLKDFEKEEL